MWSRTALEIDIGCGGKKYKTHIKYVRRAHRLRLLHAGATISEREMVQTVA
jgi:hypothetical protein